MVVRGLLVREGTVKSVYDIVSLAIFAGLIVLFLQRSTAANDEGDASLLHYLAAGIGCGLSNYLGNKGNDILAIGSLIVTVAFIMHFLKPFGFKAKR